MKVFICAVICAALIGAISASEDNVVEEYEIVKGPVKLPGQCPTINTVLNPNLSKALGIYFRHENTFNYTDTNCDGHCITIRVTPFNETHFNTDICCRQGSDDSCGAHIGSGSIDIDPENTAVMNWIYGGKNEPLYHLDTDDYESYFIGYYCTDVEGEKLESVYVLTRSPVVSRRTRKRITKVLKNIGVETSNLKRNLHHNTCNYKRFG